jgi:hypothetical protein
MHKEWAKIMNEVGANDRLLSYWLLKDRPNEVLHDFVRNGTCGEYVQSKLKQNWASENYRNRRRLGLMTHHETSDEQIPDRNTHMEAQR